MSGVASQRFFQKFVNLAIFWCLVTVCGRLGADWARSALQARLARVTQEVCERSGGTVVGASNRSLRCMSCASPSPMESWP